MTLPTTTQLTAGGCDDDSDMFGPPRSSPHHHRSRVPMISPKLRQREERKRILQLCAHKLERIKDSETNLRRSVCINNTYCRLTDELRREKQSRYLANLPKSESKPESARDNIFNPYNSCGIDSSNHQPSNKLSSSSHQASQQLHLNESSNALHGSSLSQRSHEHAHLSTCHGDIENLSSNMQGNHHSDSSNNNANNKSSASNMETATTTSSMPGSPSRKRHLSSSNVDKDLEILERELTAINAPMPLIDPELTQGAEQLEKAMISSRKRLRSEDESDRLVREALSQFYIPSPQRLISAIEDCPLDVDVVGMNMNCKRSKSAGDMDFDLNQNQKEFEVIMDALRLSTPSPTSDSCGQAAMMSESSSVFHNLVVTSLET